MSSHYCHWWLYPQVGHFWISTWLCSFRHQAITRWQGKDIVDPSLKAESTFVRTFPGLSLPVVHHLCSIGLVQLIGPNQLGTKDTFSWRVNKATFISILELHYAVWSLSTYICEDFPYFLTDCCSYPCSSRC